MESIALPWFCIRAHCTGVYCILAVVARDARAPQGHNWSYNQLKAALLLKPPSPLLLILWSFACASHSKYANLNSCAREHTLNTWMDAAGTSSLLVPVCQLNSDNCVSSQLWAFGVSSGSSSAILGCRPCQNSCNQSECQNMTKQSLVLTYRFMLLICLVAVNKYNCC